MLVYNRNEKKGIMNVRVRRIIINWIQIERMFFGWGGFIE